MTNPRARTKSVRGVIFYAAQTNPMNGQSPFTRLYYAEQTKTLQTENISVHRVHFILCENDKTRFFVLTSYGRLLPPAEMRSVFLKISTFTWIIITSYFLPLTYYLKKSPANRVYQSAGVKMTICKLP